MGIVHCSGAHPPVRPGGLTGLQSRETSTSKSWNMTFWGSFSQVAGYKVIHMSREGREIASAPLSGAILLHRFIVSLFVAVEVYFANPTFGFRSDSCKNIL